MKNYVLKVILIFILALCIKSVSSQNVIYGITNSINYISSTKGGYLFNQTFPNIYGELSFRFGPTFEISHPGIDRLNLDASILVDPKLNMIVPLYLNYTFKNALFNSVGFGVSQYNGKFNQYSVSTIRTNYTFLGVKVTKRLDIGNCVFNSFIEYNLGLDERNIYEVHPGGGGNVYFRFYNVSINFSLIIN